jgi:hypothetical protein
MKPLISKKQIGFVGFARPTWRHIPEDGILQIKFILVFDNRGFFGLRIRRKLFSTSVMFHLTISTV